MSNDAVVSPGFNELGLSEPVLKALELVGYENPSPIQAQVIPHVAAGKDLIGRAQTGTGKTAAFALPLLSKIDLSKKNPQILVLAPTRELAIQVAEAFQRYATFIKGFHVLPIYGGQDYRSQIRQLNRGVHVIVGTPGRVMDHMRRGTLVLDDLDCVVLDEADEMLRMGFIDDVEWILQQTPEQHQIALFSATMPKEIHRIAQRYLIDPVEITIKVKTTTADTINQRYWMVSGLHKIDALTRILEVETFDGVIIFVRTKSATVELAQKLEARGYSCAPLNGDISQNLREQTIDRLKSGHIDIVIATDVAARGLDVQRISLVVNYDIPYDTESYVHRIGRTGRAGRKGEAILFVAPRERRLLRSIEQATKQRIEMLELPSTEVVNDKRIARFAQQIQDTLASEDSELAFFQQLLESFQLEHNVPAIEIAAALAKLSQGDKPLLLKEKVEKVNPRRERTWDDADDQGRGKRRAPRKREFQGPEEGMDSFRIEVGHDNGVKPGNIVGAIANEANISSNKIGGIHIFEDYSIVDLPKDLPDATIKVLRKVWVAGRQLNIAKLSDSSGAPQVKRTRKRAAAGDKKPPRGAVKKGTRKRKD